jgi:hypothetical protein
MDQPRRVAVITRNMAVWLLTGGVIGPILFVVVFLVMGWTRPGYDPMSMYLSYLSRGDGGWLAIATTVVTSLLTAGGAVGLRWVMRPGPGSRWGPILIGITGVGLVLAGILLVEPGRGYPPGTPLGDPKHPSLIGALHDWAAGVAMCSLIAAMLVMARRFAMEGGGSRWAAYSLLSAVATVIFLVASFFPTAVVGMMERIALVVAAGWVVRVMWRFRREATGDQVAQGSPPLGRPRS